MSTQAIPVSIMANMPAKVAPLGKLFQHVNAIHPFVMAKKPGAILDGFTEARPALAVYADMDQFGKPPSEKDDAAEFKRKVLDAVRLPLSAALFRRSVDLSASMETEQVFTAIDKLDGMRRTAIEFIVADVVLEGAALLWPNRFKPTNELMKHITHFPTTLHYGNGAALMLNLFGIPYEMSEVEGFMTADTFLERFPQLPLEVERRLMRIVTNVPDVKQLKSLFYIDRVVLDSARDSGLISETAYNGMIKVLGCEK